MARTKHEPTLPSREEILRYIADSPVKVGKREIARAFGIKGGAAKVELKRLLAEMAQEGLIEGRARRSLTRAGELPPVAVLDIVDADPDGELIAVPVAKGRETGDGEPPRILLAPASRRDAHVPGIGDRVLARLTRTEEDGAVVYEARVIRKLGQGRKQVLGVFRKVDRHARVIPTDKRDRTEYQVAPEDWGGARNGDLVMAEIAPAGRRGGGRAARVREVLGPRLDDPRAISLIAVHEHGIPVDFPDDALEQAKAARAVRGLGDRTDLRDVPLLTIDPEDARDHDDAVHAMPDDDPKNPGGHIVTVAIADVAHYVTPGSALDRAAWERGNSCYFPDRVVPMLPERLSNELCSLNEGVDRPCLAVRMTFDAHGRKLRHEFVRGLMRSVASLSYAQVQQAWDGAPGPETAPLVDGVLAPLFAAYEAAKIAREARAPLDLDLPEHKIVLNEAGEVESIRPRERLEAHRLIEEFMILANVAAAETLERRRTPLIYRIHDTPDREKLLSLKDFLETIGLKLSLGQVMEPRVFNRILSLARNTGNEELVSTVVLRSQSQAVYSPENIGHFGLNLGKYAHFTSPIRRYADLVVHRALIRALDLGKGKLTDEEIGRLDETAEHISQTERRAMAAERDSTDRYLAAFMADRVGLEFEGRIASATRFGLFVHLPEMGADGLIPIATLPGDYYRHDESAHALVGENTGLTFRLGDTLTVRLAEATPVTGGLRFELIEGGKPGKPARGRKTGRRPGSGARGKTKPGRTRR